MIGCHGNVIEWNSPILFRYIGDNEFMFIKNNGYVKSIRPEGTYWTTLLTNDPQCAKEILKLDREVKYRVAGPTLSAIECERRPIPPQEAGFGKITLEIIVRTALVPFSIYDMINKTLLT